MQPVRLLVLALMRNWRLQLSRNDGVRTTQVLMRTVLAEKEKLGAYAMKRVAAGVHLPTPWLFEPSKHP